MRAVLIKDGKGHADSLYIGEIEKPTPGQGEVLVQVSVFRLLRLICIMIYFLAIWVLPLLDQGVRFKSYGH
jgi:hypothetical protein